MMHATLGVEKIDVECILGVTEEEREKPQQVRLAFEIDYDISQAAQSDELSDALDYDRIVEMVSEHMIWHKYRLLEAAVAGVVEMLAKAYPFIDRVMIEIRKPHALPGAAESYLRLDTGRGDA